MSGDTQIDVIVPTFHRPEQLKRCLLALGAQHHQPTAVIVVVRVDDEASKVTLARVSGEISLPLIVVTVIEPGVIAAMSAGVARSSAPLIAFTDDDSRPRPDWLGRVVEHFQDPRLGGVGGRDVVEGHDHPLTHDVGRFCRSGKLVGNHHLGTGGARTVDVLKGVNMAFRAEALALPGPGVLRGSGAQVDFEVLTCLWASRQGWRLLYDPAVLVDHEGAPRHGADQRNRPERGAIFDAAYNSVIAATMVDRRVPIRRVIYPIAVGTRDRPGLVRSVYAIVRGESDILWRLRPALSGRLLAASRLATRRQSRQGAYVTTAESLRSRRSPESFAAGPQSAKEEAITRRGERL